MKKRVVLSILATLVISTATACGTDQTAAISTNNTTPTVSESAVSEDVAIADDTSDETVTEAEGARTSEVIDLAFEITSDIDVYDYEYVDGAREYILKDTPLTTGTLIHAFRETSDGYYQIEYGFDNGYILKDNEGLSETEIGYILSDVTKNYEMLFDYTLYNGPSIHYGKSDIQLSKGDTVEIIGIAENGWLKTKDGFISFNGFAKEIVPKDTTVATTTETPTTDTTTATTTTTSDTVTAAATTTTVATVTNTGTVTTEVQARDKMNTLMASYPNGMKWDYGNSYTTLTGKTYVACDAFAYMVSDYIFGNAPYTSIPVNFNTIRIGDILTVNGNSCGGYANYGHRCVVIGINPASSCIITADGNWDGKIYYENIYKIEDVISVTTRYTNTSWVRGTSQISDVVVGNTGYYFGYTALWHDYITYTIYYSDGSLIGMGGPKGTEYYNTYLAGNVPSTTNNSSNVTSSSDSSSNSPIVADGAGLLDMDEREAEAWQYCLDHPDANIYEVYAMFGIDL